jgi:PilZ domain
MIERRQNLRPRVIYSGVLAFNERRSTVECVVRNFSDGGARIELENPALLPEQIDLFIPKKNRSYRAAIVWANEGQAGLTFRPISPNPPVELDMARRLRRCESERRELQGRIAKLMSGH